MRPYRRCGYTLLELLVVVGVLGLLVALLLPAVQRVRAAAVRADSQNRMRQLTLGMHSLIGKAGQKLPVLGEYSWAEGPNGLGMVSWSVKPNYPYGQWSVLGAIIYHLDPTYTRYRSSTAPSDYEYHNGLYQSPADPSYAAFRPDNPGWHPGTESFSWNTAGNCSYAVNTQAAKKHAPPEAVFRDGLSNTVYLAEVYATTKRTKRMFDEQLAFGPDTADVPYIGRISTYPISRRATFADERCGDAYPVVGGSPPVARGVLPAETLAPGWPAATATMFQTGVPPAEAGERVPYSPYPAGLLAAFADGSVRLVRKDVAEAVFWGSVTPAGGEVASID